MNEQITKYVAAIVREQFLLEAANSVSDAESLGLAMFQRANDYGNYVILYDPAKLAKFDNFVRSKDFVALSDVVHGYFSWKPAQVESARLA